MSITLASQRSKEICDALMRGIIRVAQAKEFRDFEAKHGRKSLLEEVRPCYRSLGQQIANGDNPEGDYNE